MIVEFRPTCGKCGYEFSYLKVKRSKNSISLAKSLILEFDPPMCPVCCEKIESLVYYIPTSDDELEYRKKQR